VMGALNDSLPRGSAKLPVSVLGDPSANRKIDDL
jgi:hypothetical protein